MEANIIFFLFPIKKISVTTRHWNRGKSCFLLKCVAKKCVIMHWGNKKENFAKQKAMCIHDGGVGLWWNLLTVRQLFELRWRPTESIIIRSKWIERKKFTHWKYTYIRKSYHRRLVKKNIEKEKIGRITGVLNVSKDHLTSELL